MKNEKPSVRMMVENMIAERVAATGKHLEYWDRETLEEFMLEALKVSFEQAKKSKFYGERFTGRDRIESLEDFSKLPFTEPHEVKNRLNDLLACPFNEVTQINMSSGTTGGPTTYVAYTKDDLRGDGSYYAPGGLFRFEPSDLVFIAVPYEMATVGTSIHRDVQRQGAAILPAGKGGPYSSPERLVQAIHDLKPTTLISTPSYAYYLYELYRETFPDEPRTIRHLRIGGEGASPAMRKKLAECWGGDVRQWYGSTEIGIIAYSCEKGYYHLAAGNTYMEIVDDEGNVLPSGTKGNVVLSTLGRVATPIMRYRNGDVGIIHREPCECGRTLPRFEMFGRRMDQIPTEDGFVSPYVIEHLLLELVPGSKPWYHIALREQGIFLVAERPDLSEEELSKATKALHEAVFKATRLLLKGIEWVEPGSLDRPRAKMRRVKTEAEEKIV